MLNLPGDRKVIQTAKLSRRDYDFERLRRIQEKVANEIIVEDRFKEPIDRVAGFDLAYLDDEAIVAGVMMDYSTLRVIEEKTMRRKVSFPYVPTFLGFREGPLIIRLAKNLKLEPNVLMVNSHGIAHPMFCGCASHVGVSVNKPTIGVAGSRLCGEYEGVPKKAGDWAPLKHQERIVGAALLSRLGSRPIFVSVGHMITLNTAIEIVKHFSKMHRFPEPLRLAHELANKTKKRSIDLEALPS